MDYIFLKNLGLNDKEVKIYLILLEHGSASVRSLADLAGLNRGTVYDVLKNLQEKGLAGYYHHETKQKFVAEDPEKLTQLLSKKQENINNLKSKLNNLVPELKSLKDKSNNRPTSKYYEGKSGIKKILEDLIEVMSQDDDKEYYVYSATNASEDINKAYPDFTKDRIKKNISVKAISLAKGGSLSGLDERRWLGTNEDSAVFCLIYSGKVAYISRDSQGTPVGVIIENEMIYHTQKLIFLQLWQHSKFINKI